MYYRVLIVLGSLLVSQSLSAEDQKLESIFSEIEKRLESYVDYDSFSASALSYERLMNKDWNPKKIVAVEKRVSRQGEVHTVEVLKATRTKDGVAEDITDKYREEQEKRQEKGRNR